MTAEQTLKNARLACTKCGHLPVCVIFRSFSQGHQQVFPQGTAAAFQIEDLAMICNQFCSKTLLKLSQANEEEK